MKRREYDVQLTINEILINKVVIDPHYEEKHSGINDGIILELVKMLDGGEYEPEKEMDSGFSYFMEDHMELEGKLYRLVWLLKEGELFIGVVNCYRRK